MNLITANFTSVSNVPFEHSKVTIILLFGKQCNRKSLICYCSFCLLFSPQRQAKAARRQTLYVAMLTGSVWFFKNRLYKLGKTYIRFGKIVYTFQGNCIYKLGKSYISFLKSYIRFFKSYIQVGKVVQTFFETAAKVRFASQWQNTTYREISPIDVLLSEWFC